MQVITRNDRKYMKFFHTHKMYSLLFNAYVTYAEILKESVKAFSKITTEGNNAENLQALLLCQTEQRFFNKDLELCLQRYEITILEDKNF